MSSENIYREHPAEVATYICGLIADKKILSDGVPAGRSMYNVDNEPLALRVHAVLSTLNVQSQWTIVKHGTTEEHMSEFVIQWSSSNSNRSVTNDPLLRKMYLRGFLDATLLPQSLRKTLVQPTDDALAFTMPKDDPIVAVLEAYLTEKSIYCQYAVDEKEGTRSYQFLRQTLNDFLLSIYTELEVLSLNENSLLRSKIVCQVKNLNTNTPGLPTNRVALTHAKAVFPSKSRFGDVGYDLTLVDVAKKISDVVTLYETGVIIEPSHGWYAEVVPRSSIIKTGYMLANCAGIIDPPYRGSIKVALIKVDPNAPELDLSNPEHNRPVQIIFRPYIHHTLVQVEPKELSVTERNDKGFGSSNQVTPATTSTNNNN